MRRIAFAMFSVLIIGCSSLPSHPVDRASAPSTPIRVPASNSKLTVNIDYAVTQGAAASQLTDLCVLKTFDSNNRSIGRVKGLESIEFVALDGGSNGYSATAVCILELR